MSKSVWKYPILAGRWPGDVEMPKGAQILDAQIQNENVVLWALVDTDVTAEMETRSFSVYGTGWDGVKGRHISTVQDGAFVWHVFEVTP